MSTKSSMHNPVSTSDTQESAVPTLRVMRLQSPDLYMPSAGSFESWSILGTAMCLPDSLGVVYVGETFSAYLGVLNVSKDLPVKRLTVTAQLQTPSQRWRIPSNLDAGNAAGGVDVPPENGIDTVISHPLEEAGSHILRVEVGYMVSSSTDGSRSVNKTFRKFYRFNVNDPLSIRELTIRSKVTSTPPTPIPPTVQSSIVAKSTTCCYISITVEYNNHLAAAGGSAASAKGGANPIVSTSNCLTIASAEFHPVEGLIAERINTESSTKTATGAPSAVALLDNCGRLQPGHCRRYLFKVRVAGENERKAKGSSNSAENAANTTSDDIVAVNDLVPPKTGIAAGDELGKAIFTWSKTMGETGRIASSSIYCPECKPFIDSNDPVKTMTGGGVGNSSGNFIMSGSGLSDDVAAIAARKNAGPTNINISGPDLDALLPITVEPLNPPTTMKIATPHSVQFRITNHTTKSKNLQLLFQNTNSTSKGNNTNNHAATAPQSNKEGLVVCGQSCKSLGTIHGCSVSDTDNPYDDSLNTTIVEFNFIALSTGLLRCIGCCVIDLDETTTATTGYTNVHREIPQPPLFDVFVEK